MQRARFPTLALAAICLLAVASSGCGLQVSSADLFLLTRTGQGPTITLLVNDGGTVRCNGGRVRPLPDPLLLQARDIADELDKDVKSGLRPVPNPRSVFSYSVRLQDGTLRFPDTAAGHHVEIARAEQFTLRAAQTVCGLAG